MFICEILSYKNLFCDKCWVTKKTCKKPKLTIGFILNMQGFILNIRDKSFSKIVSKYPFVVIVVGLKVTKLIRIIIDDIL